MDIPKPTTPKEWLYYVWFHVVFYTLVVLSYIGDILYRFVKPVLPYFTKRKWELIIWKRKYPEEAERIRKIIED